MKHGKQKYTLIMDGEASMAILQTPSFRINTSLPGKQPKVYFLQR